MMKANSWLLLGNTNVYLKDSREVRVNPSDQEKKKLQLKKSSSAACAGPRKHLLFLNPK